MPCNSCGSCAFLLVQPSFHEHVPSGSKGAQDMILSFRQLRTAAPPYRASGHENVNRISNGQGRARAARECRKRDIVAHIEGAAGTIVKQLCCKIRAEKTLQHHIHAGPGVTNKELRVIEAINKIS